MRKILFLMSVIAVFASCNLERIISDKKEINNISVVQFKGGSTVSSLNDMDLCKNYHRNDTLFLELIFSEKVIAYPYSELKEEYLDSVKNYKISMIAKSGGKEYIPAIIVPSSTIVPVFKFLSKEDKREFRLKSILKDSDKHDYEDIPYIYSYLPLYLWGFPTPGNALLYDSQFFFSENSVAPTITTEPFSGGKYSVVADYDGKLQLCQMIYDKEEDMIVLRIEDGKTYRYPAALAYPSFREDVVYRNMVSACITPSNNWFPVRLGDRDFGTGYVPTQLNVESDYLIGGLWKIIKIKDARNYLFSKGMAETMINSDKLFFTREEMNDQPPKEDLNLEEPVYRGFVDDFGQITMNILDTGGHLEGAFYFETEQKNYSLNGYSSMDEEHPDLTEDDITLTASRNNEEAGRFEGRWIPGKSFSGVWKPKGSYKSYSFKVTMN